MPRSSMKQIGASSAEQRVRHASAHARREETSSLQVVNGRVVGTSLADPKRKAEVQAASKRMFDNKSKAEVDAYFKALGFKKAAL